MPFVEHLDMTAPWPTQHFTASKTTGVDMDTRLTERPLPLVTIGVPIYNEIRFLESALSSLLAQDYGSLEIVISDNASDDGTQLIAERIADENPNVRYSRSAGNIGAAGNFQRVLAMADGKYFMWAAGHDQWSENLVSACVDALETNPTAAIAVATSRWIDETDARMDRVVSHYDTRSMSACRRFFTVFWGNMHPVLGLMRLSYLRQTNGMQAFAGSDLVLLSELVLMGNFVHVKDAWWSRRQFRPTENHGERLKRYTSKEFGQATSALDKRMPLLRLPFALISTIWRAPICVLEKLLLLLILIPLFPIRYVVGRRAKKAV